MKRNKFLVLILMAVLLAVPFGVSAAAIYDHEVTLDMNNGSYIHDDIRNFGNELQAGITPKTMLVFGDSTSNALDEWPYLFEEALAESADDYSFTYKLYNSVNSSFDTKTVIQYGTEGDAYAAFSGLIGESISALNSEDLSITGDIDLRAKVKFDPGQEGTVVAKADPYDQKAYTLYFDLDEDGVTGIIRLYWTTDGSTSTQKDAQSSAITLTEDTPVWIKATLDVDNGSSGYTAAFYYSYDGVTYTAAGTTATAVAITSIFDSTADVTVGYRGSSASDVIIGNIYDVEIRDGIDGKIVASLDMDQAFPSTVASIKDVEGNTWVFNYDLSVGNGAPGVLLLNASIAGAATTTFDASELDAVINTDVDLFLVNFGHNVAGDAYVDLLENFIASVKVYTDEVPVVLMTQNYQYDPVASSSIVSQAIRMDQIHLVASENDYAFIDVASILDEDPATYIGTDGIHPTDEGSIVWADTIYDVFNSGITGEGSTEIILLVQDADLIVEPNSPIKSDETFIGWFTDEEFTDEWDFDTDLVQENMTLYAMYSDDNTGILSGVSIFAPSADTLQIFGIAWYWYGAAAVVVILLRDKKRRKALGKKLGLK